MLTPTAIQEKAPNLGLMVRCANCGSAMNRVADQHSCPNSTPETGQSCSTPPVNADRLLRRVISKLIERIITTETQQLIAETIRDKTQASVHLQRERLETAESAISRMNRRRTQILHPVEQRTATYPDVADEIHDIEKATSGLAYESMIARDELEKLEYIRDEASIKNTMANLDTYLGTVNAAEIQELLDMTVQEVQVNDNAAKILYAEPILSEEHPEGIESDLISLN